MESSHEFSLWMRSLEIKSSELSPAPNARHYHDINYIFTFETLDENWIISQDSSPWRFHSQDYSPASDLHVCFNASQLLVDYEEGLNLLERELRRLPVLESSRRISADYILRRTIDEIKSMRRRSLRCKGISLRFHLRTYNVNVSDGGGGYSGMIPASETVVDLLETEVIEDDDESCSICKEDFEQGFEGTRLPCLHVFHGDCIKEWLRISHYCPLCRYELPAAVEISTAEMVASG